MRFAHFFEESYHKKFPPRGKLSLFPALEKVNNYDDDDDDKEEEEEVDNNNDHE